MKIDVSVNIGSLVRNLQLAQKRVEFGAKKAVDTWADKVEEQSLMEVPRDTGSLANSFFRESTMTLEEYSVTVGYGSESVKINPKNSSLTTDYMLEVHENLDKDHPNGGKAKFLEDPVRQITEDFLSDSADIIRQTLGG